MRRERNDGVRSGGGVRCGGSMWGRSGENGGSAVWEKGDGIGLGGEWKVCFE